MHPPPIQSRQAPPFAQQQSYKTENLNNKIIIFFFLKFMKLFSIKYF